MDFDKEVKDISTTTNIKMASTMKKAAMEKAVAEGTFYECKWCGKEGTNSQYKTTSSEPICGRAVVCKTDTYCSYECCYADTVETNNKFILERIDWANHLLDMSKEHVADAIKHGLKLHPVILLVAKIMNILKKVLTLIISGDKPAAQKLYDEKKATITDCAEDLLADDATASIYMNVLNNFSSVETMLGSQTTFE